MHGIGSVRDWRHSRRLQWCRRFAVWNIATLAFVWLDLVLCGKIVRVGDAERVHELLLLRRARLASGPGSLNNRRRFRRDRCPFMQFLTKKVGLKTEKNVGAFDFAKIEAEIHDFLSSKPNMSAVRANRVTECLGSIDDARQGLFLFWLKG